MNENNMHFQLQWLVFKLNDDNYCIEVAYIKEVLQYPQVWPVPGTSEHVHGIMNLRGDVIGVNDLKVQLGLSRIKVTKKTRIILLDFDDMKLALLVDGIIGIIDIKTSEIEEMLEKTPETAVIQGTCERDNQLHILLSVNELMKI